MINSREIIEYTKNLSILFVEDDDELRKNTSEILKNFFHKVDTACNGEEALTMYQNNASDIVLTDIRMPKMNGVELTQNIYAINDKQAVIVLSAHDESKYLLPLINLGIEQFIKKPIDFQELLGALLKTSRQIIDSELRKGAQLAQTISLADECSYDRDNRLLICSDEKIYLTKYEILFIQLITTQIEKVYSNEDIVEYYIENGENISIQNIRKLVSKLRKKLPEEILESIYGVGYRLSVNY
jgi:DNA-binding response OmpR family regulator